MLARVTSLSVGAKVLGIVGLCLLCVVGISAYAITQMKSIGGELEAIAEQDIPLTEILTKITTHQMEQAIAFERAARYGAIMARDAHAAEKFEQTVEKFKRLATQVDEEIKTGEELAKDALAHAHSPAEADEFQHILDGLVKVEHEHAEFDEHALEAFALLSDGFIAQALDLEEAIEVEIDTLDHELQALLTEIETFTAQAARTVEQHEKDALLVLIVLSVALLVVALGLSLFLVRRTISRPLKELVGALDALIAGDTDVTIAARANDEIGAVARALGLFQEKLADNKRLEEEAAEREQQAQLERRKAQLKMADDLETGVKSVVASIAGAATEMQATADGMASSADRAAQQSASVAGTTEQASANVQTVAAACEQLTASISEIDRQVRDSREVAGKAEQTSESASETIRNLDEMAQKVGEVLALINDIAEQTNLLALNATIEAARAGDAGKGFAVVASEVKSLANQTAQATEEISGQITGMQSATEESVKAIGEIREVIHELGTTASSIASAVEEQSAATQQISSNIQEAASGTQEVASSISSVQAVVSETGSSAQEVLEAAGELSRQSETLDQQMEAFLAETRAG